MADTEYYQKEAQLAKLGERRPGQEATQLKKTILALQRQVACLEKTLARCTCGAGSSSFSPSNGTALMESYGQQLLTGFQSGTTP